MKWQGTSMRCNWWMALIASGSLHAQSSLYPGFNDSERADSLVRIAFWNVENLFDTEENPACNDNDFTPTGQQAWTEDRYFNKRKNLAKTLGALGGWELPEIIGLAEVENRTAVEDLIALPPLKKGRYKVVHYDSPDPRCIDVALMYKPDKVKLLFSKPIPVRETTGYSTRDILLVKLLVGRNDTVFFLVNHWPSRRGGEKNSEPKRIEAAQKARLCVDSIFDRHPHAQILLMGDFNDYPTNASITQYLKPGGQPYRELINLAEGLSGGSHQYQGVWDYLDQMLVSPTMAKHLKTNQMQTFQAPWLFDQGTDPLKPTLYRTFVGPRYQGGFSDHLPVYVDYRINRKLSKNH
jgi:predicted extracellular nuclease